MCVARGSKVSHNLCEGSVCTHKAGAGRGKEAGTEGHVVWGGALRGFEL